MIKERVIFADGRWLNTRKYMDIRNPYTGELVGKAGVITPDDTGLIGLINESTNRAKGLLREMTSFEISEILFKGAEKLKEIEEDVALLIAREIARRCV